MVDGDAGTVGRRGHSHARDTDGLAERNREVAFALRRLGEGDLAGMFDGPTTLDVDLTAPVVSLNLRAVYCWRTPRPR